MRFKEALKAGEEIEYKLLERIKRKYPKAKKVAGKQSKYDIFIPELGGGIEVKADFMSKKTGNIVVEIEFNGKPSALSVTEAFMWVFFTGDKYLFIYPNMIKSCITENNLKIREFIGDGDTVSKKAYLVKQDLLSNYAEKIIEV
jgi:hypothetical protein